MLETAVCVLALLAPTQADRGANDTALTLAVRYIDAAARQSMEEEGTPGMAIGLVLDGRPWMVRTYGVTDLGTRAPVKPDTRFLAGSISKMFTAVALLQLSEEGLVDLKRPLTDYLPWFRVKSEYPAITLHHLLTHTAGLQRDRNDLPSSPFTALALRDRPLVAPPGDHFAYSNIGYQLLSLLIAEVEGRSFGESIRQRILLPLGMSHTSAEVTLADRTTSATGYQYLYDDRPPYPGEPLFPAAWGEYSAGDANIITTAPDLALFLSGLLAQGGTEPRRLLHPASFARMVQRTVPAPELGNDAFYGYGVILGFQAGDPVLWHSGGMAGFRSMLLGDADERVGVVVLMNGPGNPRRVARYALDVLISTRRGRQPPPVEVAAPLDRIPGYQAYIGSYSDSAGAQLRIEGSSDNLWLVTGERRLPLLRGGEADQFLIADSAWALFPIKFARQNGQVTELWHGDRWFMGAAYQGAKRFHAPADWTALVGHYRAQIPYYSSYRVLIRKGVLLLVSPEGIEERLTPLSGKAFRVGSDPRSAERASFMDLVSGRALRMNLSGTDYYRTMTP